MRSIKRETL